MTDKNRILSQGDIQRFWEKVNKSSPEGCWEWISADNGVGYGKFYIGRILGKNVYDYAHRISWRLVFGDIPKGIMVLHKCDNPKCINPSHLFLGTQTDNMRDAASKGRIKGGTFGERQHSAKLKSEDIPEIMRMISSGISQSKIAKIFGVSPTTILYVKTGRNWSWLTSQTGGCNE